MLALVKDYHFCLKTTDGTWVVFNDDLQEIGRDTNQGVVFNIARAAHARQLAEEAQQKAQELAEKL